MPLRPRSLRSRLAVLFALGTGVLLVASALFLYVVLDGELQETIDDGLRARTDDVTAVVQTTGAVPDGEVFAQLLAADGTVLDASATAAGVGAVLDDRQLARAVGSGPLLTAIEVGELGGASRALATPLPSSGGRTVLVVASSLATVDATRNLLVLVLGGGGPLLIAVLAGGGWWLAGAALRPVDRMTSEADAISTADAGSRLAVPPGDDEVARLGRTLNAMLDRIAGAVAHERQFLDDASHELRTPIAILRAELELALAEAERHPHLESALRSALEEAERLGDLASDLLVLARARAGGVPFDPEAVDVVAFVRHHAARLAGAGGPEVVVRGAAAQAHVDPDRLQQVVLNLLHNALTHAASAVEVEVARTAEGDVRVRVADDGPGFTDELLVTAFDRFSRSGIARGRETGGAGLGLAIVAALVAAQGGTAAVSNGGPLGGAVVTVVLPGAAPGAAPAPLGGGHEHGRSV